MLLAALVTAPLWASLAGCASTPVATASPGQDVAGKLFSPPPPGLGAVYFYNPSTVGPAINVAVGPQLVGRLGPRTWARVELNPGWHVLWCHGPTGANTFSMSVSPGDMRFVDVHERVGATTCSIEETPTAAGRASVMGGTRALQ